MSWRTTTASLRIKTFVIALLIIIAVGSFAYTQFLIIKIRENERSSIELWAKAMEYTSTQQHPQTRRQIELMLEEIEEHPMISPEMQFRWRETLQRASSDLSNAGVDFVANELIINNRFEIPSVGVDENNVIQHHRNVNENELGPEMIAEFATMNEPIKIYYGDEEVSRVQYFYYGDSAIVRTLKVFPYVQFGLLALFLGLGYASLSSIKRNEQSKLWVGMARESAHQLGTPISSLMGWIALLKDSLKGEKELETVHELEKDVERLQSIAERFNKIGSEPELKLMRVGPILDNVTGYMSRRMPQIGRHVNLEKVIEMETRADINAELFKWAIENLIKNAIDALDGIDNAKVVVRSSHSSKGLVIDVEDNGKGIERRNVKEVFNPGFSTKKRGWGLGLSLTRRIVEEYHGGSIIVHKTEPGKGTTFRITLPVKSQNEQMTLF